MSGLLLALALGGCRGVPPPATLHVAHESCALSLDPVLAAEAATQSILGNFYEGLVALDRNMAVVPALAESWTTPDERVWVFRLRQGARFHDGSPVRAEDAAFSLERARRDPASRMRGHLISLESVAVSGERELRLVTRAPDPLLPMHLAYVMVVPRSRVSRLAAWPIGTGPYRLAARRSAALEAEAFEGSWRGLPPFPRVSFECIEDGARRLEALREGRVDVLRFLPPGDVSAVAQEPGLRLVRRPGLTSVYLWFGEGRGSGPARPFADRRVRRAVAVAIDRNEVAAALEPTATPAGQLVSRGVVGHDPGAPALPFDPDGARLLLAQAGYGAGFEIPLSFARGAPAETRAAIIVQRSLSRVGVRVRLEPLEWDRLVAAWAQAKLPFFLAGWRFETGDALGFYQECLHSRSAEHGLGAYNPGREDALMDRLIDDVALSAGPARRQRAFARLASRAASELPLVPLYVQQDLYATSRSIVFEPRLDSKLLAWEMGTADLRRFVPTTATRRSRRAGWAMLGLPAPHAGSLEGTAP